jgi:hypothetical protein
MHSLTGMKGERVADGSFPENSFKRKINELDKKILEEFRRVSKAYFQSTNSELAPDFLLKKVRNWVIEKEELHDIENSSKLREEALTPLIDEILEQYLQVIKKVYKFWLLPHQVMEAVCEVLVQNVADTGSVTRGCKLSLHEFEILDRTIMAGLDAKGKVFVMEQIELIGEGLFGKVFRIISTFKKEMVAKIGKPSLGGSVLHEWNVLNELQSKERMPGIQPLPKACCAIEYDGTSTYMLIMERYKASLSKLLDLKSFPFSTVKEVLSAFRPLFYGLLETSKFWFHNDVKTENIFVKVKKNEKYKLKIADWGVAQRFLDTGDVLKLGKALHEVLACMFSIPGFEYGCAVDWKGLKKSVPSKQVAVQIKTFVCSFTYEKNKMAKVPTLKKAVGQLDEILKEYTKEDEKLALVIQG